jgi:FtsH-binding integral membrane protein
MGRIQRGLSALQLLGGVTIGLFLAGVIVPTFLRSGMAANHGSAGGSLYALTIAGVTFRFTLQNVGSALLGGVFGALIALAIEFPDAFAKTARNFLMFKPAYQKLCLILRELLQSRAA